MTNITTFAELVNEPFKNLPSGVTPPLIWQGIRKPANVLVAMGSIKDGDNPYAPVDYHTDHSPRDGEWPRKAKNILEHCRTGWSGDPVSGRKALKPLNVPGVEDEPIGLDEVAQPGRRTISEQDACDYFAVADLFGAGGTIHAQDLMMCKVPRKTQDRIARKIADVWRDGGIPLDASSKGTYTRGPLPECPLTHSDTLALRTFGMVQGKKATCVVVRPTKTHKVQAQGGWKVDHVTGPHGQIVHLTHA